MLKNRKFERAYKGRPAKEIRHARLLALTMAALDHAEHHLHKNDERVKYFCARIDKIKKANPEYAKE